MLPLPFELYSKLHAEHMQSIGSMIEFLDEHARKSGGAGNVVPAYRTLSGQERHMGSWRNLHAMDVE